MATAAGPEAVPVRSYVDTTIGCVFFNVMPGVYPEVLEMLAEANRRRKESREARYDYAEKLMALVRLHHYPLYVHEWSHVLQALAFPALYFRCLEEFGFICAVVDDLAKSPGLAPIPFQVRPDRFGALSDPTKLYKISLDEGEPELGEARPDWRDVDDLAEADLLEDCACLFQYRAEIGGDGRVDLYRRWLDERSRYTHTFDYLCETLSPEDAYVALPCLVMAAYTTSRPLASFASLLGRTIAEGPGFAAAAGTDAYWAFLEGELSGSGLPVRTPEPREDNRDGPAFRFDGGSMRELAEGMPQHPLSPLVERAWRDADSIAQLQQAMLHPALAFSRRRREPEEWVEALRPPLMHFRMLADGFTVNDTAGLVSETVLNDNSFGLTEISVEEYLVELARIKAFVFATGTSFFDNQEHVCPHVECPFHDYGMCRRWNFVPPRFEECNFPDWLEMRVKRRLDFDTGMLVPVDTG